MSRSRNLADLLDANGDVNTANLDNVPAPDLVNDTTPQLGGNLDGQSYNITTTGNVGIGTASPGEKLDVIGNIKLSGADTYVKFINAGGYDFSIRADNGNALRFYSPEYTADPLVSITNGGNVGIGTSSPTSKLDVTGDIASSTGFFKRDGNNYVYVGASSYLGAVVNGSERMRIDSSGNLKFNSGYGSAATAYGCRAWVQWNGTSNSIIGNGNVSSITDNGTGDFSINFSTSMPDTYYTTSITRHDTNTAGQVNVTCEVVAAQATSNTRVRYFTATPSEVSVRGASDPVVGFVVVHR